VGQHRSTQRKPAQPREADAPVRCRLREISKSWPQYGYRRAWAVLRREGYVVNRKRVQRLWREEGLRVPPQRLKRRRLGTSTVPAARLVAERPNHVWALDFQFDVTSDGRPLKALAMCDEFTRESIGNAVARSRIGGKNRRKSADSCSAPSKPRRIAKCLLIRQRWSRGHLDSSGPGRRRDACDRGVTGQFGDETGRAAPRAAYGAGRTCGMRRKCE
jgi:transposase InsO family protein